MPALKSSNLESCDWQPSSDAPMGKTLGMLTVVFKSGKSYMYEGVPEEVYQDLLKASSPGKYFNQAIKDVYAEA